MVTTGRLEGSLASGCSAKYRFIWRMRSLCIPHCRSTNYPLSPGLLRGCRPNKSHVLVSNVAKKFCWANPLSLHVSNVPVELTVTSLSDAIEKRFGNVSIKLLPSRENLPKYEAYVVFKTEAGFRSILNALSDNEGFIIGEPGKKIDWLERQKEKAQRKLEAAKASFKVFECSVNKRRVLDASHEIASLNLGLRMRSTTNHKGDHVVGEPAVNALRGRNNCNSPAFLQLLSRHIKFCRTRAADLHAKQREESKREERLKNAIERGVTAEMQSTSAFEQLHMLRDGLEQSTVCSVCLGFLGENSGGMVSLTRCGHIFCTSCLEEYFQSKGTGPHGNVPCITCRKPFDLKSVRKVDPKKTKDRDDFARQRQAAKSMVERIAEALDESNGQLNAEMWESLYLAFDTPVGYTNFGHATYTAIPSHFLAHLHNASRLPPDASSRSKIDDLNHLSTKLRALLEDISRDELSVVFASSKSGVKHIGFVLGIAGIQCRSLFRGQAEHEAERALEEWKGDNSVRVLVVQAGAAACGLTLTAASRMYIMEPFLKHEEEKQAYARLHRYGQSKEVICKVYYTPVSVESRLLEWRKRAEVNKENGEEIIYAKLREQTRFLLGIDNK